MEQASCKLEAYFYDVVKKSPERWCGDSRWPGFQKLRLQKHQKYEHLLGMTKHEKNSQINQEHLYLKSAGRVISQISDLFSFLQGEIQKLNATQISECSDMGKFEQHLSLLC